jgi:hypothetical protein
MFCVNLCHVDLCSRDGHARNHHVRNQYVRNHRSVNHRAGTEGEVADGVASVRHFRHEGFAGPRGHQVREAGGEPGEQVRQQRPPSRILGQASL